jgi:hypothetical protein
MVEPQPMSVLPFLIKTQKNNNNNSRGARSSLWEKPKKFARAQLLMLLLYKTVVVKDCYATPPEPTISQRINYSYIFSEFSEKRFP